MLTLRITEDSAKQLMINQLFGGISKIRLLGEGYVSYVSPAHSEILINRWNFTLAKGAKNFGINN